MAASNRSEAVGASEIQFWSLVKITSGESEYAFKCLHQQDDLKIRVACFSPVEMPLFTVSIDGNSVSTEASSDVVLEKIPFDLALIGRDVWRAHVAMEDADLADFDIQNDPDLVEKKVIVTLDDQGRPLEKTFFVGDETVVEMDFLEYPKTGEPAGRIEIESLVPSYLIEIVQGD